MQCSKMATTQSDNITSLLNQLHTQLDQLNKIITRAAGTTVISTGNGIVQKVTAYEKLDVSLDLVIARLKRNKILDNNSVILTMMEKSKAEKAHETLQIMKRLYSLIVTTQEQQENGQPNRYPHIFALAAAVPAAISLIPAIINGLESVASVFQVDVTANVNALDAEDAQNRFLYNLENAGYKRPPPDAHVETQRFLSNLDVFLFAANPPPNDIREFERPEVNQMIQQLVTWRQSLDESSFLHYCSLWEYLQGNNEICLLEVDISVDIIESTRTSKIFGSSSSVEATLFVRFRTLSPAIDPAKSGSCYVAPLHGLWWLIGRSRRVVCRTATKLN